MVTIFTSGKFIELELWEMTFHKTNLLINIPYHCNSGVANIL